MNSSASAWASEADNQRAPDQRSLSIWRYVDWIWHVRGSVPLAPGQTSDDAFKTLDPLFREVGTTHERAGETLWFRKKDPVAQDKLSVFDHGVLRIERGGAEAVLRYDLFSRALLFCFLAPLLFVGFGQLTVALNTLNKPSAEAAAKAKKKDDKKDVVLTQNPIDRFLGSPAPEKPKKDDKDKAKDEDDGPSPTPAYVFAGIFAALYVGGRILEDWLIRRLFGRRLTGA